MFSSPRLRFSCSNRSNTCNNVFGLRVQYCYLLFETRDRPLRSRKSSQHDLGISYTPPCIVEPPFSFLKQVGHQISVVDRYGRVVRSLNRARLTGKPLVD